MAKEPLERILLPMDLSPASELILDLAARISVKYGSELVLFHAIDEMIIEHVAAGFDPAKLIAALEDKAKKKLLEYRDRLESAGAKVSLYPEIPVTDPAVGIAVAAKKSDSTEILVATRGRGLRRFLGLGSTVRALVKLSEVPVVSVRVYGSKGKPEIVEVEDPFKSIVVGLDENWKPEMVEYAARLAAKAGADTLYLVRVKEGESEDEAKKLLDKAAQIVEAHGVKAIRVILEGKPHKELVRFAVPPQATSILIGRTTRKRLEELILGSTLDRVLVEAEVPVIVYPLEPPKL